MFRQKKNNFFPQQAKNVSVKYEELIDLVFIHSPDFGGNSLNYFLAGCQFERENDGHDEASLIGKGQFIDFFIQ